MVALLVIGIKCEQYVHINGCQGHRIQKEPNDSEYSLPNLISMKFRITPDRKTVLLEKNKIKAKVNGRWKIWLIQGVLRFSVVNGGKNPHSFSSLFYVNILVAFSTSTALCNHHYQYHHFLHLANAFHLKFVAAHSYNQRNMWKYNPWLHWVFIFSLVFAPLYLML